MDQIIHINASDGRDFYQKIAVFAYGSFVQHGHGAVIVTEGEFRVHGDGRVEAALAYIPFSQEAELPDEVIEQVKDYEAPVPEKCVPIGANSPILIVLHGPFQQLLQPRVELVA